jgi:hypothetical protein
VKQTSCDDRKEKKTAQTERRGCTVLEFNYVNDMGEVGCDQAYNTALKMAPLINASSDHVRSKHHFHTICSQAKLTSTKLKYFQERVTSEIQRIPCINFRSDGC